MTNFRSMFSMLITILVVCNCTPTKLTYINFSDEKIATENQQKIQKLNLINENNSPLHRIMWLYRSGTTNITFKNNVSSFHIGNGIVISVAHNLRNSDRLPMMVSDNYYENELLTKIDAADSALFNQAYPNIQNLNYRILTTTVQSTATSLANKLDTAKVDRRYKKLYADKSCKPFLVLTFRNNAFFGDTSLNAYFDASHSFYEQDAKRYTFLIELELLDELVNEDIAIYRIINTDQSIINKLPYIDIDFNLYDIGTANYYCLQTAPYKEIGRLLNEARIEGVLDNYSTSKDILGNLYIMDGTRYLIQGYFRFGSSGAPYVIYDEENQVFKANAVQSQASYVQMAINNDKKGNFQYINAIATPFSIIEEKVKEIINKAKKK